MHSFCIHLTSYLWENSECVTYHANASFEWIGTIEVPFKCSSSSTLVLLYYLPCPESCTCSSVTGTLGVRRGPIYHTLIAFWLQVHLFRNKLHNSPLVQTSSTCVWMSMWRAPRQLSLAFWLGIEFATESCVVLQLHHSLRSQANVASPYPTGKKNTHTYWSSRTMEAAAYIRRTETLMLPWSDVFTCIDISSSGIRLHNIKLCCQTFRCRQCCRWVWSEVWWSAFMVKRSRGDNSRVRWQRDVPVSSTWCSQ